MHLFKMVSRSIAAFLNQLVWFTRQTCNQRRGRGGEGRESIGLGPICLVAHVPEIEGLGFEVWGLRFGVEGLGFVC